MTMADRSDVTMLAVLKPPTVKMPVIAGEFMKTWERGKRGAVWMGGGDMRMRRLDRLLV